MNLEDLLEWFEERKVVKKEEVVEEVKVAVQLIGLLDDDKRIQQLNLSVKKLTVMLKLSFEELRQMVITFDDSVLGFDGLTALAGIAPTKEEITKVKAYTGDKEQLDPPSRWIYEMKDVPIFKERLDFFVFKTDFPTDFESNRRLTSLQ